MLHDLEYEKIEIPWSHPDSVVYLQPPLMQSDGKMILEGEKHLTYEISDIYEMREPRVINIAYDSDRFERGMKEFYSAESMALI